MLNLARGRPYELPGPREQILKKNNKREIINLSEWHNYKENNVFIFEHFFYQDLTSTLL